MILFKSEMRIFAHEVALQNISDPELVIGIVGRLGVDTKRLYKILQRVLREIYYETHHIKITNYLKELNLDVTLKEEPIEDRYASYIDACNHIREKSKRDDFFASYAVEMIRQIRHSNRKPNSDDTVPLSRVAYVIDQIKRPEEVLSLRQIYGDQFILISAHMPMDKRMETLSSKIASGHAGSPRSVHWSESARALFDRDEKESNAPHGQRVSDVFPMADVVVDSSDEDSSHRIVSRFFEALFGNFKVSPTRDEFFQNIAYQVSLTSCDTARQVGAVIERSGDLLCTGFNEAPRAHGGTYWAEEGSDARDVAIGKDVNTVRKRQMVLEILSILRESGKLNTNKLTEAELEDEFMIGKDALLSKTQILDTLEYGRAVHAEMAAITTAARNGLSVSGGTLYCTTFPCHNCAKHIVASGIRKVFYLEPYAKSYAQDLYPDSILIDKSESASGRIDFRQFVGITPNRFSELFFKDRIKDERGNIIEWVREVAQPTLAFLGQSHIDREVIFQKKIYDDLSKDEKNARYLGVVSG